MICKMAATEVADSLGYCLKAEPKQAILLFVDGIGVFISLSTGHEVMTSYRTTKALCKSSIITMHTLHNNCITLPQLVVCNGTRPFSGGGAGLRD